MRRLKSKLKEYSKKDRSESKSDAIDELKRKMEKRKGQYTKQDQLSDVKDNRYSVKTEPMYHEMELEKEKNQPKFIRRPKRDDVKGVRTNSHKKSVEPPDEEVMETYPPENTKNNLGKDKRKKMAAMVISRKMKKR